jgi:hypothetical protein
MQGLQTVDAGEKSGLLLGVRVQQGVQTRSNLSAAAAVGWWWWDDGDGWDGFWDADGWDGDGWWGDGWDGDI